MRQVLVKQKLAGSTASTAVLAGLASLCLAAAVSAQDDVSVDIDETAASPVTADPVAERYDDRFDAVTCCVSVDYLTRPVEVFREVARVLRPGGVFVCTFSNRCFPTKAIRGWLATDDRGHCDIVATLDTGVRKYTGEGRSRRNADDPSVPRVGEELRQRVAAQLAGDLPLLDPVRRGHLERGAVERPGDHPGQQQGVDEQQRRVGKPVSGSFDPAEDAAAGSGVGFFARHS